MKNAVNSWTTGNNSENKITWTSESKFVDMETGELIDKEMVKAGKYEMIKSTKKTEISGNTGKIIWTNECRKRERYQGKLFS